MVTQTTAALDHARTLWDAGLTPMPRVTGYVEPSYITDTGEVYSLTWSEYKTKQPDWATVARWFTQSDPAAVGLTLLTGSHAHPRAVHTAFPQIVDIETPEMFEAITEELHFSGHSAILHRCVIERTPSGGGHIGFGCTVIGSTQKLALARRREDGKLLVELLQHQPCTIAPTSIRCKPEHPEGATYHVTHGDWAHLLEISPEQRQILLDVCRAFNEVPGKEAKETHGKPANGTRPGDLLNARADLDWWQELLTRHDWRDVSRPGLASRGITYWQRPGKIGREPSATYGATGPCLYVFSSNAQPFDPDTAYTPFAALSLLEHDGDFQAAAKAVARHYGLDIITAAAREPSTRHTGQSHPHEGIASTTTSLPTRDPAAGLETVSPCTHVANAARIARDYADRLHYVLGRGWILWTGQYWRTDPTAEGALATGFVSGLARTIAQEAATLLDHAAQEHDKNQRETLMKLADARIKWAVQSENERVIASGLKLAKRALLIEHRAINPNPWLLNCDNVTVDLRTGKPHPHNPDDLITHIAPVRFDPDAICPTWEHFLSEVFEGDMLMVRFIQRAIGWSLTGVVQERALFFLYGPKGHNGKTTLVEIIRDLLGDCGEASFGYARKVDVSTFMQSKNQDDNQRKAAMLAGPRFVYSSEVDAEHRLNEQLIKDITGGDTLEGRYLYREAFTFKPTFKAWMYGNHKPEIRGTDDALWSRVKLVPFEVSFADRIDLTLPDKLRAELPGILNWAIAGCLDWQQGGLRPPEKVTAATQRYRLEQDHIAQFIKARCRVLPAASIKAKRLYARTKWCGENGHESLSQNRFGATLLRTISRQMRMPQGEGPTARYRSPTTARQRREDDPVHCYPLAKKGSSDKR